MFKFFAVLILIAFIFLNNACSSSSPKEETVSIDSTINKPVNDEHINDEPPQPAVSLPEYDGTIERGRKQVEEIMDAIDTKRLMVYSYQYDNKSGEDPKQGTMYLS